MDMPHPIYLDHNATTPVDPVVYEAMEPFFTRQFGNPSSVEHVHGNIASRAVETAREQVAELIGARPNEIIFTGGCTEANNLAILGLVRAETRRHAITTAIEHPAVLEPMKALQRAGWSVTVLPVDTEGSVHPDQVGNAITSDTALVSVMAANNEIGTVQRIGAIGAICAQRGVLFHTDLAQYIAYASVDVDRDNIHLASISAHKAYGPKGIGALYVRSRRPRVRLTPLIYGGGQERGLRSGTLNTPAIVGFGAAMQRISARRSEDVAHLRLLSRTLVSKIAGALPTAQLNGDPEHRVPSNVSFSIAGVEPLALVRSLRHRISFSASSACATEKMETSHVLKAMFGDSQRARGAFRLSPGRFTTLPEIECAANWLVEEARRLSPGPSQQRVSA